VTQLPPAVESLRRQIDLKDRLPVWRLRLVFGGTLMLFSELVEWPVLLVLYVALGSIMLDLIARFGAFTPAALGLASGVYGVVAGSVINHAAFENLPYGLLVRAMGLQVGAGYLALILFVVVLRGRPPELPHLGIAALIGLAWGIWLHWWPIQPSAGWGLVTMEYAQLVLIVGLVLVGALYAIVAPRFGILRETQMGLYWWEMILVGVPLFITLLVGMVQRVIPFGPLLFPAAIGGFCIWALRQQSREDEPSVLGNLTFLAPNLISYVALAVAFLLAGALAYPLVADMDSPLGVALYVILLGFGSAWLPFASGLILWAGLRRSGR
jgi:hypothetical protein